MDHRADAYLLHSNKMPGLSRGKFTKPGDKTLCNEDAAAL
jgi:hypothetical protein